MPEHDHAEEEYRRAEIQAEFESQNQLVKDSRRLEGMEQIGREESTLKPRTSELGGWDDKRESSGKLDRMMELGGEARPSPGHNLHHLVPLRDGTQDGIRPQTRMKLESCRRKLDEAGIPPNSQQNLVYLPEDQSGDRVNTAHTHHQETKGQFLDSYADNLHSSLNDERRGEDTSERLASFKSDLSTGRIKMTERSGRGRQISGPEPER